MRKKMPKNTSKNLKIKQKTRHDPTPKNEDSQISSAKAVLGSIFARLGAISGLIMAARDVFFAKLC